MPFFTDEAIWGQKLVESLSQGRFRGGGIWQREEHRKFHESRVLLQAFRANIKHTTCLEHSGGAWREVSLPESSTGLGETVALETVQLTNYGKTLLYHSTSSSTKYMECFRSSRVARKREYCLHFTCLKAHFYSWPLPFPYLLSWLFQALLLKCRCENTPSPPPPPELGCHYWFLQEEVIKVKKKRLSCYHIC